MRKKSITISDIAEKTGYSKTTVSFAFNWPNRISASAVEKIMQCAKEMGYKGSLDSYNDTEQRYKTICILVPETFGPTGMAPEWARPTLTLYYLCEQHGFMLSLIQESHLSDSFFAKYSAVDAFLLFGKAKDEIDPSFLDIARRRHIPLVSISSDLKDVSDSEKRAILNARTSECANLIFDIVAGRPVNVTENSDAYIYFQN